jgi:2-polyprenyl-6-methoxyphenol hydroxylase-like FAD-dependent oxidoreductase
MMRGTNMGTAVIVGGGIAGTAAAIALQEIGIEPAIYEARHGGPDQVGAFLTLATNGIDALRALGVDGPVLDRGFATPDIILRSNTGKRLGPVLTGVALPDGTLSHTLKRADLYAALTEAALARGIRVEHGRKLVDAQPDGDGVRAIFADGNEAAGRLLIGADGVHSAVRRVVDSAAPPPHFEGLLSTGGYAHGAAVAAPVGSYEMILGRRAFFGYVPAPTGEVWWFANLPAHDEPPGDWRPGGESLRARLIAAFADDAGPACELIRGTPELADLTPLHTIPRLNRWHRGSIVLIGDAAHAPSPTSGQGASLSIEDAAELAWAIRRHESIPSAFTAFEAARRRRVEPIVKAASRMNTNKAPGPIGRIIRDAMMPTAMRLMTSSKMMRKPFEHHIEPLLADAPAEPGIRWYTST